MSTKTHYCAGCGRKIITLHVAIPGRTRNRELRYHPRCKPKDEHIEVIVEPGKPEIDLG